LIFRVKTPAICRLKGAAQEGSLVLLVPDAQDKQKTLLQNMNDIILHIRYISLKEYTDRCF